VTPATIPRSDEQLIAAFRSGDDRAFAVLGSRYKDALTNLVHRLTGTATHAVVRDVFLEVKTSGRRFDQKHPFYIWAYRAVLRRIGSVSPAPRGKGEPRTPLEALSLAEELTAAGAQWQPPSVEEQMQWALKRIPVRMRAGIVLHDIHGMSPEDLGRVMRRSRRSVERLLDSSADRLLREVRARTALLPSASGQDHASAADDVKRLRSILRGLEWKTAPWYHEADLLQAVLLRQDTRKSRRRRALLIALILILLASGVVLLLRYLGLLPSL